MIKRYSIYWVNLDPVIGAEMKKRRPAVVVSQESMNRFAPTVVVCPLTSTIHPNWRSRIQVECSGQIAEIAADQIRTVSKKRIGAYVDELREEDINHLKSLIVEMYGT